MPCKAVAPIFEEFANKNEFINTLFIKLDIDKVPSISEKYNVMAVPTFLFMKNNNVIDRFSGGNVPKLEEMLRKHQ